MKRPKINYGMSMTDIVVFMAEGNPGGLTTLLNLMEHAGGHGLIRALDLDDMNMRGSQIWVGFKYYCEGDMGKFAQAVQDRDPKMVKFINEYMGKENFPHKAVTSGGSF